MGQEEVLGAVQADAAGPDLDGHLRVGRAVDVGQQLHLDAVARDRLLIAILDQPIAQIDIFALQLAIRGLRFRIGFDVDVAFAGIESDEVAGLHLLENAAHAGNRGNAQRPGQNGRVPGAAPRLGDDAGHLHLVEHQGLRRQDFRSHDDQRFLAADARPALGLMQGQLRHHPAHHVADVGDAFLQIFVGNPGEQGGVFVEHFME